MCKELNKSILFYNDEQRSINKFKNFQFYCSLRVSHIDIGGRRSTHKRHKKFERVTLKSFHIQPLLISGIKFGSKRQKGKCVSNNATQIDKMYRGSNNCIYVISIMFFLTLKIDFIYSLFKSSLNLLFD